MVVREGAVDLAVELLDLGADGLQHARAEPAGHAGTGVDHHPQRALELDVAGDALDVFLADVALLVGARRVGAVQLALDDARVQRLDGLARERLAADDDLEAVVVGRVVAAGDRHAGARAQRVGPVVHQRRGREPDVDDVAAGGAQALDQRVGHRRAGQAAVAAHDDLAQALLVHQRADGLAQRLGHALVEALADHAAHVVGAEDRAIDQQRRRRIDPPARERGGHHLLGRTGQGLGHGQLGLGLGLGRRLAQRRQLALLLQVQADGQQHHDRGHRVLGHASHVEHAAGDRRGGADDAQRGRAGERHRVDLGERGELLVAQPAEGVAPRAQAQVGPAGQGLVERIVDERVGQAHQHQRGHVAAVGDRRGHGQPALGALADDAHPGGVVGERGLQQAQPGVAEVARLGERRGQVDGMHLGLDARPARGQRGGRGRQVMGGQRDLHVGILEPGGERVGLRRDAAVDGRGHRHPRLRDPLAQARGRALRPAQPAHRGGDDQQPDRCPAARRELERELPSLRRGHACPLVSARRYGRSHRRRDHSGRIPPPARTRSAPPAGTPAARSDPPGRW